MTNDNAQGAEQREVVEAEEEEKKPPRNGEERKEIISHVNATGCMKKLNSHHHFHYTFRDISFTPPFTF